jgi:hypothetical protein
VHLPGQDLNTENLRKSNMLGYIDIMVTVHVYYFTRHTNKYSQRTRPTR